MKLFQKLIESVKQWVLLVPTLRNIQDFIWFSSLGGSFLNGFLGLDWNDKFGVNAKFKCLEKWFRSYASVMILTIYILLGSHPMVIKYPGKKTGKLFNVVLVQLVLRCHVLGLLSHLVQEVASLALRKRLTLLAWGQAFDLCFVLYIFHLTPWAACLQH